MHQVTQRLGHGWRVLLDKIGLLSVVAPVLVVLGFVIFVLAYAVPPFRGSPVLQFLGPALFGAGLSALLGTAAGRDAVHQQSAREANLTRKRETYGPLYAELKAVRSAFDDVQAGRVAAPERIDNGVEPEETPFVEPTGALTLKLWPEFRRDYRDTDFKVATQDRLDRVQDLATAYNTAVEAAREAALPLLAAHADSAVTELQQAADYQQRRLSNQAAPSAPRSQAPKTPHDWYAYIEFMVEHTGPTDRTVGQRLAAYWVGYWGDSNVFHAFGWLLARHPDKAAEHVSRSYTLIPMQNPPPPLEWIQHIFEQSWPDLQQAAEYRAAQDALATFVEHMQAAEGILDNALREIQEKYEGGEPIA